MEDIEKRSNILSLFSKNLTQEVIREEIVIEHESNTTTIAEVSEVNDFSGQLKGALQKEFELATKLNKNLDKIEKMLMADDFLETLSPTELIGAYDVLAKRQQNGQRVQSEHRLWRSALSVRFALHEGFQGA